MDLSLVDPDNRRPVDNDLRRRLLAELAMDPSPEDVLAGMDEGLPKLWLVRQALRLRASEPDAFGANATYRALWPRGARADHVFAFARDERVVAIAPIRPLGLGHRFVDWDHGDTSVVLPPGPVLDVCTGARVDGGEQRLEDLLRRVPVALLVADRERTR